MWSYILLAVVLFLGYCLYVYVQNMKASQSKESFEVAAADIKKLVDHLDSLSKDFSDTVTKLKEVTADAAGGSGSSDSSKSKSETFSAKRFSENEDAKKKVDTEADNAEADEADEDVVSKASAETFANRMRSPARKAALGRRGGKREGFVNGVSSKMSGNYMLL